MRARAESRDERDGYDICFMLLALFRSMCIMLRSPHKINEREIRKNFDLSVLLKNDNFMLFWFLIL